MNIGRAFTYVTEDQEWWKKLLIVGLISLIPVVGPFYVAGYVLAVLKNILQGRETPLPQAVEDFGGRIVKGLMLGIILFVYMLPLVVLGACSGGGAALFPNVIDDQNLAGTLATAWSGCFGCLALLLGVLIGLLAPFLWGIYAETGSLGAAFQVGKVFGMLKSVIGPTFVVLLVSGVAAFAAVLVGTLLCGIGNIFTITYLQAVMAFLYGSLYKQAQAATR